jgi:hypothetical protein
MEFTSCTHFAVSICPKNRLIPVYGAVAARLTPSRTGAPYSWKSHPVNRSFTPGAERSSMLPVLRTQEVFWMATGEFWASEFLTPRVARSQDRAVLA